jgi:hypothetical protein
MESPLQKGSLPTRSAETQAGRVQTETLPGLRRPHNNSNSADRIGGHEASFTLPAFFTLTIGAILLSAGIEKSQLKIPPKAFNL